jgi:hypothetical protein
MWFTHAVDADKKAKIERLGLPAIEIYLGDLNLENGFAEIEERVLGNTHYKEWLFHPEVAAVKARFRAEVDAEMARRDERHAKAQEAQRRQRDELNMVSCCSPYTALRERLSSAQERSFGDKWCIFC